MSSPTDPTGSAAEAKSPSLPRRKSMTSSDLEVAQEPLKSLVSEYEHGIQKATMEFTQRYPTLTPQQLLQCAQLALNNVLATTFEQSGMKAQVTSTISADKKKPIRGYIDGCFDIMHSGHYNAVRQAKSLCDVLVVGVHSNAEIEKHKGPPVMNDEERLATVRACKWADEVVFDTPYDPSLELLDKLNCDFCVHGDDMSTTSSGEDAYAKVKQAGRMRIVKRTEGVSTTDLVGRLLLMTKQHHITSDDIVASASPAVSPALRPKSPSDLPTSTQLKALEELSLSPPRVSSSAPVVSPVAEEEKHYSSGISNFLPTTYRITQFSNGRTPSKDDKVVYIDGAFDLFHIGHIETLAKAKALGTFLYVGVHDDATVNHHKGRNYPIMNLHERVLNVLSCVHADEVVIGAPWELTEDLIKTLNIQVVASGSNTKFDQDLDCTENDDPYSVAKKLGIYHQVQTSHSLCTEDVVKRIIDNRLKFEKRNEGRSKKDLNYFQTKEYIAER